MRQAVILAGGQATRMRPYTDDRPKAMVEVGGAPLIDHQLRWLAAGGIEQVVMSCGYKADVLEAYLNELRDLDIYFSFAIEEEPLGRGGGLKYAAQMLPYPDEAWLGLNCDIITRFPLPDLAARHGKLHNEFGVLATICLAPYRSNWGVAELDGDLVVGFVQSPRLPYWINAGVYALEPEIVGLLPEKGDHEDTTFPQLAEERKIAHFQIEGYWRGIDTIKDIEEAGKELRGR